MENGEKYTTSDGYLTAYLIYKGFKLLTIDVNNGWGFFVFENSQNLQNIVAEFFSYKGSIPPRKMAVEYRKAVRFLHENKGLK